MLGKEVNGKQYKVEENLLEEWLTETYAYERPTKGDLRKGILLDIDEYGAVIDIGLKHDGIVPRRDIDRLTEETLGQLQPGQEVTIRVLRPNDQEDSLILSLAPVQTNEDWARADEMLESGDIWYGEIVGYNKGGLLVDFGHLQGFIPGSHLTELYRKYLPPNQRNSKFKEYMGRTLPLKVIESNRDEQRLILSERLAREQAEKEQREALLDELSEGQICKGRVSHLTDFGAFVDLGGVDGLVHISELAWRRVKHPREVVEVGDEIEVKVLDLDYERKRISLSLKRLKPNPWDIVQMVYTPDQLVGGRITSVVKFGAFMLLDIGVEGLVHISELADPTPHDPRDFVSRGDEVVARILYIDPADQRISLSIKQVSEAEKEEWLARQEAIEEEQEALEEETETT